LKVKIEEGVVVVVVVESNDGTEVTKKTKIVSLYHGLTNLINYHQLLTT